MKRIHLAALMALIGVMIISLSPPAHSADGMQLQMRVVDPSKRYVPPKPRRDIIVFRGQSHNTSWLDPDFSNVPGYDPNMASAQVEAEAPVAPVVKAAAKLAQIKPAAEKKLKVKITEKASAKKVIAKVSPELKAKGKAMKVAKDMSAGKSKIKPSKKTLVAEKSKPTQMTAASQTTTTTKTKTTTLASNSSQAARSASLALMSVETPEIAK